MRKRNWLLLLIVLLVLGVIALGVYLKSRSFDTILEFQVRDVNSKNWVWNANCKLQNRLIRAYFQTDSGPRTYTFTHLKPGAAELEVSAPYYQSQKIPLTLKRGKNALAAPIDMLGLEIPALDHFIVFEERKDEDIALEIRPVGKDGKAVLNHPCLDLWIGAMVSTQMKNGKLVLEPTEEGSARGEVLLRDKIQWEFDPAPETVFRYSAKAPLAKIKKNSAPFWVMDYLIVVPNPAKIGAKELNEIMTKAYEIMDFEALKKVLDQDRDRFRYFISTSWNVKGGQM